MKISTQSSVPVYTISGSSTARPLPEWLARRRKRSLKNDPEYANRVELLQDFEFEEASQCIRISEDGQWVMSTGMLSDWFCLSPEEGAKSFLQGHTNRKSILTTYLTFRYPLLVTPSRLTRHSFYSHPITRNLYICRQIGLSSFIRRRDVTTRRDCLVTDGI